MKINSNYKIVNVAGDYMAVPVGTEAVSFHGVIALNEAAAYLLDQMNVSRTKSELKKFLLEKYDVEETVAEKDIDQIIDMFLEIGLVVDE